MGKRIVRTIKKDDGTIEKLVQNVTFTLLTEKNDKTLGEKQLSVSDAEQWGVDNINCENIE